MRKFTALGFAICGTLLVVLLFIAGRMLYVHLYSQSFADIAETDTPAVAQHYGKQHRAARQSPTPAGSARSPRCSSSYTYKPYPHLFQPGKEQLTASRLTVTFENGNSIGVNADGYVFVGGKLRDIEGGRGQEFYQKLYVLVYPNAS